MWRRVQPVIHHCAAIAWLLVAEHNVRTGFFEPDEYQAVLSYLLDHVRSPVRLPYLTGWRMKSEVLSLTWNDTDFNSGQVRLEAYASATFMAITLVVAFAGGIFAHVLRLGCGSHSSRAGAINAERLVPGFRGRAEKSRIFGNKNTRRISATSRES